MALPLLEGIDLALLLGVFMLIATLAVIGWTFKQLANVLNFSVLGVHPLRHVATAIENTIVAGCNAGIKELDKWAIALWHWAVWSFGFIVHGFEDLANGIEHGLSYFRRTVLPNVINASLADISKVAGGVAGLAVTLGKDVKRLDARIDGIVKGFGAQFATHIHSWWRDAHKAVSKEIGDAVSALPAVWAKDIQTAIAAIPIPGNTAADVLTGAAEKALEAAQAEAQAARDDVKKLLNEINPTDIAAVISGFVLLRAAVNTLEAETGLENESCRSKVKGICATDSGAWNDLLALAAPFGLAFGLRAMYEPAREIVHGLSDVMREVA